MNALYAFLNIILPSFWDEGWSDPSQVVALVLAPILFIICIKWIGNGIDGLIFKAIDGNVDGNTNPTDPKWAKNVSIAGLVIVGALALYTIVSTDWAVWYEERRYFIWFIATFASFLAVSSIGAWIDRKGKLVSIPVFLLIVGVVVFVIYNLT